MKGNSVGTAGANDSGRGEGEEGCDAARAERGAVGERGDTAGAGRGNAAGVTGDTEDVDAGAGAGAGAGADADADEGAGAGLSKGSSLPLFCLFFLGGSVSPVRSTGLAARFSPVALIS